MNEKRGSLCALSAYILWGLLPLYWKLLKSVPPDQILAHRMVWSAVSLVLVFAARGQLLLVLRRVCQSPKSLIYFLFTALIISSNWFVYIWAVNSGYVIESSLGYFINPLVSVSFGVVFLKERLRFLQIVALICAISGVLYMTVSYGRFPWIALTLASTFAVYGLMRKVSRIGALEGLFLETLLLFVPALGYLIVAEQQAAESLFDLNLFTQGLLILAGPVTALPLLLFAAGARAVKLSTLGFLQYVAPTLQFLLGVFWFKEQLPIEMLITCIAIWSGLVIFTIDSFLRYYGRRTIPPAVLNPHPTTEPSRS